MQDFHKLDKETQKSIRIFFAIFSIFILIISVYNYYNEEKSVKKKILNENYNRIVDSIYNNREEHNFTYVKYSDGRKESMPYEYNLKDSLSKKKGDSIEYIYRNGRILQNNLFEAYRNFRTKK